jgi:hypothetical protein
VIQVAAGSAVVVNGVARIVVAAGPLVGIDTIPSVAARTGRVAVVVNFVIEHLVIIAVDRDPTVGTVPDLKPVYHVVLAIDVQALVAVGKILPIKDGFSPHLRLERNRV